MESVALDERSILELDDLSRIVVDQTNREIMASQQDGQADDDEVRHPAGQDSRNRVHGTQADG